MRGVTNLQPIAAAAPVAVGRLPNAIQKDVLDGVLGWVPAAARDVDVRL